MADRVRPDPLDRALRALAAAATYPPTPSLSPAVTSRLLADRTARARPAFPRVALWSRRRTLVVAVLGLLLLGGAAVAARLSIGAVGIRVVESPSTPRPAGTELSFGRPVPFDRVEALAGFEPVFPPPLGQPDEVHLARSAAGRRVVVLAWRAEAGAPPIPGTRWAAILMELPGRDELAFKEIAIDAPLEGATVNGRPALWVGGPHDLVVLTPTGQERFYVRANVLIWQERGLTLRLETPLSKPRARALAGSIP